MRISIILASLAVLAIAACSKEETPAPAKTAEPAPTPAPTPSVAPAATPSATASAAPTHECPKNTVGDGTFAKPCEASGKDRAMEVTWTSKTDDKGPHFKVTNKTAIPILYGKMAVYFYDKAGKQIEVKDDSGTAAKSHPYHTCSGNMFGGVMKPNEKAVLTFSCVQKKHVPEGTAAIEAEMIGVGYSDASEKKVEYYWSNPHLAADKRAKGGVK